MFFPPSSDLWKEEGRGVCFFLFIYFFIIKWLRRGGQGFFFFRFVEVAWEGGGG
jgi:hypothetical protein